MAVFEMPLARSRRPDLIEAAYCPVLRRLSMPSASARVCSEFLNTADNILWYRRVLVKASNRRMLRGLFDVEFFKRAIAIFRASTISSIRPNDS